MLLRYGLAVAIGRQWRRRQMATAAAIIISLWALAVACIEFAVRVLLLLR